MIGQFETELVSHLVLAGFDGLVEELFHVTAVETDDVVVMRTTIKFENRVTAFEIMALHKAGALELGQHTVDSRKSDFLIFFEQNLVDILGTEVLLLAHLENLEDLDAWQRDLESGLTYVVVIHRLACLFREAFVAV